MLIIEEVRHEIQRLAHRAKKIYIIKPCRIKLNIYKLFDDKNQLVLVDLVRNQLKSYGKEEIYYTHNHILEYIDIIKVNFKVKNTVRTEVAKKYWLGDIKKNI